jgi:hypothetical protein
MPGRGPQTFKKRQKEQQRKERQQEKMEKRLRRKEQGPAPEGESDSETPVAPLGPESEPDASPAAEENRPEHGL